MDIAITADIIDADDIRMRELACGLCFMAETQDEVFVFCKIAVQDLHRYDTIQKDVLGHIDISHTAGANLFDQLISFVKNLSYHCLLRLLLIVIGHGNLRNRRSHCGISISLKGAAQKKNMAALHPFLSSHSKSARMTDTLSLAPAA